MTGLPDHYRKRVLKELDALPLAQGKATLTIEVNCGTGGSISSMKVKTITECEVRST
jgi:hypothetical protein